MAAILGIWNQFESEASGTSFRHLEPDYRQFLRPLQHLDPRAWNMMAQNLKSQPPKLVMSATLDSRYIHGSFGDNQGHPIWTQSNGILYRTTPT